MNIRPAYLLDSDVLIWHLRRRAETMALLQALAQEGPLACSVLSISEVLRLAREDEIPRTERLLNTLIDLPVSKEIAILAALLMRDRGPGYVDSHIAATALLWEIPLVTYNRKDFERTGVRLFDTSNW